MSRFPEFQDSTDCNFFFFRWQIYSIHLKRLDFFYFIFYTFAFSSLLGFFSVKMCFWTSSSQHLESTGSTNATVVPLQHWQPVQDDTRGHWQRRRPRQSWDPDNGLLSHLPYRPIHLGRRVSGQAAAALIWLTEYSVEFAQQNLFPNISLCKFSA